MTTTPVSSEPCDVAWTVRLRRSTADAIEVLAAVERRKRAELLRLLVEDGYEARRPRGNRDNEVR